MQRKIIDLPCSFGPLVADWVLNIRGRSAGEGITGVGQVAYGLKPRWEAALRLSGARRDQVMIWRAIRASMRGRINVLRVCLCDMYRPTLLKMGMSQSEWDVLNEVGTPHSDETLFSDDTGYDIDPVVSALTDLPAGTEFIAVDNNAITQAVEPGNFFSVNDYVYQITQKYVGAQIRFYFEPPLREAMLEGQDFNFRPHALMVFESDLEGRMPLQFGRFGETDINLLEWVNR